MEELFKYKRWLEKIFFFAIVFLCWRIDFLFAQSDLTKTDSATTFNELGQMSDKDKSALLSTLGVGSGGWFSWGNIVGGIIFGSIGFIAFMYGRKQQSLKPLLIGIALMVYPYFIQNTFWLYAVGVGLCGLLFFYRD